MSEHQASRTLVKSPPELWSECSDARSLARHLGDAVGEIRIKRLEPETTVAWEGEHVSGTVRLEPSGWGTKVTLTATAEADEVAEPSEPEITEPPEPGTVPFPANPTATPPGEVVAAPQPDVPEPTRTGFMARLRRWLSAAPQAPVPPEEAIAASPPAAAPPVPPPAPPEAVPTSARPEPAATPEPATNAVDLTAALDSLGKAHHRPFSRA
jgi:hypothetical protein